MRGLKNMNQSEAKENGWEVLKDLGCEVVGKAVYRDGDVEIMKSTKRFPVEGGWVYNTTTEIHREGNVSVAEALVFVPCISR